MAHTSILRQIGKDADRERRAAAPKHPAKTKRKSGETEYELGARRSRRLRDILKKLKPDQRIKVSYYGGGTGEHTVLGKPKSDRDTIQVPVTLEYEENGSGFEGAYGKDAIEQNASGGTTLRGGPSYRWIEDVRVTSTGKKAKKKKGESRKKTAAQLHAAAKKAFAAALKKAKAEPPMLTLKIGGKTFRAPLKLDASDLVYRTDPAGIGRAATGAGLPPKLSALVKKQFESGDNSVDYGAAYKEYSGTTGIEAYEWEDSPATERAVRVVLPKGDELPIKWTVSRHQSQKRSDPVSRGSDALVEAFSESGGDLSRLWWQ